MSMTLSMCSTPSMRVVRADGVRQLVGLFLVLARLASAVRASCRERLQQDVVDERDFAGTADAGDADEHAERDLDVDVLQVVVPGADDA